MAILFFERKKKTESLLERMQGFCFLNTPFERLHKKEIEKVRGYSYLFKLYLVFPTLFDYTTA